MNRVALFSSLSILAFGVLASAAMADEPKGFLESIHKHTTLSTTAIANGDLNPYAVVVAPVSSGKIQKDDVLISNFNDISNLQGTGTTIVDYNPTTKQVSLFAKVPKNLPNCPGGIGLTTAMTMLQSGWIIVGSTPSTDGTTKTKGQGCLIVLDNQGKAVNTITSQNINGPWGNMAVIDNSATATLFVSNAGFDIPGPEVIDRNTGFFKIFNTANVLRIELSIPAGKPPVIKSQMVIADGLSARADKDAFMTGPTGLALAPDGTTLYVSDAINNRIVAIDNAPTRKDSAGTGREIVKGGLLKRPLAMIITPQGPSCRNRPLGRKDDLRAMDR
jgi:DNA-binding beta-propeller fold protein YncE